jgi:uncharacterized protein
MFYIVTGLLMGFVFGWALEKSRVFEPGMIVGQMQLRNFIMLKVFLSAVATGLVVIALLYGFGYAKLYPKDLYYTAVIVGGLMLGAGITLSGACPGTVLAQAGAGYRDAWFTILGGIAGAMAFGYFEPEIRAALLTGGAGKLTFPGLTGLPFWQIALAAAIVIVALLWALERARPWRGELGANADGFHGGKSVGEAPGAGETIRARAS